MDIEIIELKDKNNREVWRFYWENAFHIWLDEYRIQIRKPHKQKWEDVKFYTRMGDIRSIPKDFLLDEKEVVLSNNIIAQVREWITLNTKIEYWSERR